MRKSISILLIFSFVIQLLSQSLYAQYLPNLSTGISGISTSSSIPPAPALLRYVSVNSANPFNYFNFLLDKGNMVNQLAGQPVNLLKSTGKPADWQTGELNSEAKKLVNYFFLGLTIPEESLWVNLQPNQQDEMVSKELANTDMGKVLLEQDLQLKKDMAKYLHPQVYEGQLFWRKLEESVKCQVSGVKKEQEKQDLWHTIISNITKHDTLTQQFDVPYRVWIVPDSATVVETEDGALVTDAKLKVMLEVEYLEEKTQGHNDTKSQEKTESKNNDIRNTNYDIQEISKQLLKQIIIPKITQAVNESPKYAPLRQIYYSLILAQWYKVRHSRTSQGHKDTKSLEKDNQLNQQNQLNQPNVVNPYAQAINKGWTKGLEAEFPWSKQKIWQEYQQSYSKGEYTTQASLIGIGVRKFFSGGMALGIVSSVVVTADNIQKLGTQSIPSTSNMAALPVLKIVSSPTLGSTDTHIQPKNFESVSPLMLKTDNLKKRAEKFPEFFIFSPTYDKNGSTYFDEANIRVPKKVSSPLTIKQPDENISFIGKIMLRRVTKKIEGLEERYAFLINKMGKGFSESYYTIRELERTYSKLQTFIKFYLKAEELRRTIFYSSLNDYSGEIEAIHRKNMELMWMYDSMVRPEKSEKTETDKEKYNRISKTNEAWNNCDARLKALWQTEVTQKFNDAERIQGKRIVRDRIFSILQEGSRSSDLRLTGRFKVVLYSEVFTDTLDKTNGTEKQKELFWNNLSAVRNENLSLKADVRHHMELWGFGEYGNEYSQKIVEDKFQPLVIGKISQELRKKGLKQATKAIAFTLGSLALIGVGLQDISQRIRYFQKGKQPALLTEIPSSTNDLKREGLKQAQEDKQNIDERAKGHKDLTEFIQPITAENNSRVNTGAMSKETAQEIALLQAEIEQVQKKLDNAKQKQGELNSRINTLSGHIQEKQGKIEEKAKSLAPIEGVLDEDSLSEPKVWQNAQEKSEPKNYDFPIKPGKNNISNLSEFDSTVQSFGIKGNPSREEFTTAAAKVQGGNRYLKKGHYSRIDPITGRLFSRKAEFKQWLIKGGEEFSEWVLLPEQGKPRFYALVPPGYVVTGILSENSIDKQDIYYDKANGAWLFVFDKDPGRVKIGIRQAKEGELAPLPPLELTDEDGNILSQAQAEQLLRRHTPETLNKILDAAKNLPVSKRREVIHQILGIFNYSVNPLVADSRTESAIDLIFKYYAVYCSNGSFLNSMLSYRLGLPAVIAIGYTHDSGGYFSMVGHSWVEREDNNRDDSVFYVGTHSPYWKKDKVTAEDWQEELKLLSSQERLEMINKKLEKILFELIQGGLENEINEARKKQEDMLQKEHDKESNPVQRYSRIRQDYRLKLESLENEKGGVEWFKRLVSQISAENEEALRSMQREEQLMGYTHYLLGILDMLEKSLGAPQGPPELVESIKDLYKAIADCKAKIFNCVQNLQLELKEPLQGAKGSDNFYQEPVGGKVYIVDRLTEERIEIPEGSKVVDYVDGLVLLREDDFEKELRERFEKVFEIGGAGEKGSRQYFVAGEKAGEYGNEKSNKYFSFLTRDFGQVKLVRGPFSGNDWLAVGIKRDADIYYFGPVAEREGIEGPYGKGEWFEGKIGEVKDVTFISGKSCIRLPHQHGNMVKYAGEFPRGLRINGGIWANGLNPIELSDGTGILAVQDGKSYWYFFSDGDAIDKAGLENEKFQQVIKMKAYSGNRWIAFVQFENGEFGYVGKIDDQDIEKIRLKHREYDFIEKNTRYCLPVEAPDGSLVLVLPYFIGYGDDDLAFVYRGAWANSISYINTKLYHGPLNGYAFQDAEYPIFFSQANNKEWILEIKINEGGVKQHYWLGPEEIKEKYKIDETVEYIDYPEFDGKGSWMCDVTRKIASYNIVTGIRMIEYRHEFIGTLFGKRRDSSEEDPANFLNRSGILYNRTMPGESRLGLIPPQRLDLSFQRLDALSYETEENIMSDFFKLIGYMSKNREYRYYNRETAESFIRHNKKTIAVYLSARSSEAIEEFLKALYAYNLKTSAIEIIIEMAPLFKDSHWLEFSPRILTRHQWQEGIESYLQSLRQSYQIKQSDLLLPFLFSKDNQQKVDQMNKLVISQLGYYDLGGQELKKYYLARLWSSIRH